MAVTVILSRSDLKQAKCFMFFFSFFLQTTFRPEAFYPSLIALWDGPDQSDGRDPSCVLLLAGLWRCALKGVSHSSSNSSKGYSDRPDSGRPPRTHFFVVVAAAAWDIFCGASIQSLLKSQWDGSLDTRWVSRSISANVSKPNPMLS